MRGGFICVDCGHDFQAESRALAAGAEGAPTPIQVIESGVSGTLIVACAPNASRSF